MLSLCVLSFPRLKMYLHCIVKSENPKTLLPSNAIICIFTVKKLMQIQENPWSTI